MKPKEVAQKRFTILIDMDGVLADFVGGVEKEFDADLSELDHWGIWKAINEQKDTEITSSSFWNKIKQNQRFWADLKPYPWARDLVNTADEWVKGDTCIVTSPDTSISCASQKTYWVNNHFPHFNRKLFIGARKELMADDTTILIDDSQENCDKFREHGGIAIEFPQLWNNENRKPDMRVVKYIEQRIRGIIDEWATASTN